MEELKEKIEAIVKKLTENKELMQDFKTNPIKTVEKLLGIDLPDETIEKIVDGVKAKITMDKIDDLTDGKLGDALGGMLKKLF